MHQQSKWNSQIRLLSNRSDDKGIDRIGCSVDCPSKRSTPVRLNCMPLCDSVLVMDKGEIIEQGSRRELLKKGQVLADLWQL